MALKLGHCGK